MSSPMSSSAFVPPHADHDDATVEGQDIEVMPGIAPMLSSTTSAPCPSVAAQAARSPSR
jgi:hypothetical protein